MKNNIILILFIQLVILGCGKDKETRIDTSTALTLEVSEKKLLTHAEGGELNFNITSNCDWVIRSSNSWCKLSSDQGNGDASITIKVLPFEEYEQRSAEITVKADTIIRIIEVIQKQKNALILSDNHFNNIPVEGKEISVEVKSNVDYDIIIPDEMDWIKQVLPSRALESNNYKFEITANSLFDEREGIVIFKDISNVLTDTIFIIQDAVKAVFGIKKKEYKLPVEGGEISVKVTSNVDLKILIPDEFKSWIKLIQPYELGQNNFYFKIEANEECETKKGIVVFSNELHNISDTIFIEQEINTSERAALVSFYKALNGDKWYIKTNWLSDKPVGEWYGITTNALGQVVKIDMKESTGLCGNINFLEYLSQLEYLGCKGAAIVSFRIKDHSNIKDIVMCACDIFIENCPNLETMNNYADITDPYKGSIHVVNCPNLHDMSSIGRLVKTFKLERCPNLANLTLGQLVTPSLSLTSIKNLEKLEIRRSQIDYLNIEGLPKLQNFSAEIGILKKIDISNCMVLRNVECVSNGLSELEIDNCDNLTTINVRNNKLTKLDVSTCQNLKSLTCNANYIYELRLNSQLGSLYCFDNQLQVLNLTNSPNLKSLNCSNNKLTTLDISPNIEIRDLRCANNQLQTLDLTNNPDLDWLDCNNNKLSSLDISQNIKMQHLSCSNNQIQSLDLTNNTILRHIECGNNKLTTLDIASLATESYLYLDCLNNPMLTIWTWEGFDQKANKTFHVPEGVEYKIKQ